MSKSFFWREISIWKYTHRRVRLAMSPCHSPRQILQIKFEYIRLQEIAISCNLKQHTVESDLNEIWHSFYIPMRPQASYFHTLLIIKKGGGKGCAHDTCKVLMGSKMCENEKIECIQIEHMGAPPFPPPFVQWWQFDEICPKLSSDVKYTYENTFTCEWD